MNIAHTFKTKCKTAQNRADKKQISHERIIYDEYQYHKYKLGGGRDRWSVDSKCLQNVKLHLE